MVEAIETILFACKLNPDYAYFSITTPYPATELYDLGISKGLLTDKWGEFAKNPEVGFTPDYWEEHLNRQELDDLISYAYKRFCFRPNFVFKQVIGTRSISELFRKTNAGLRVLTGVK